MNDGYILKDLSKGCRMQDFSKVQVELKVPEFFRPFNECNGKIRWNGED